MMSNVTEDLCRVCDGSVECAPAAILLVALVQTLYGQIGPEPDYFGRHYKGNNKDYSQIFRPIIHYDQAEQKKLSVDERHQQHQGRLSEYDFIVVGGGTAGCVVASRLSENSNWKVLLIEAGPEDPKVSLIPGLSSQFKESTVDWKYSMRPRTGVCQNRGDQGCELVQGRVLGGSSTINDMAYMRGNPADYDDWTFDRNDEWSFDNILQYYKYSEGNYDKDIMKNTHYHSTKGPLDVGRYPYVDENVDILLNALHELGYNYTDINGPNQIGFMRIQTTSFKGERVSTYTAFIDPIKDIRTNLDVVTEALVTRIIFSNDDNSVRAIGIEFWERGEKVVIKANNEIILSAGAINSPKLLMQSGIGPREYLEFLGLFVYQDLPVGHNFQDHISVCLPIIKLGKTATTTNYLNKLKDITAYYSKGMGPLSSNFQVVAFLESSMSEVKAAPDIEIRFRGQNSNMYYDRMDICVSVLTPKSRGNILLNSSEPVLGNPLIYPNFLKDPSDESKLLEGIQESLKILDTDVFKESEIEFDPKLLLQNQCKDNKRDTESFWRCIVKYFSSPLHNYVGTCKMGSTEDPEAVVDTSLKVFGVLNLRVVDSSVIPKVPRGSTMGPTIMVAEKASEIIKKEWY